MARSERQRQEGIGVALTMMPTVSAVVPNPTTRYTGSSAWIISD